MPSARSILSVLLIAACGASMAVAGEGASSQAPGAPQAARPHGKAGGPHQRARRDVMRPQVGKASIYADKFANRKMANGKRMDPQNDNAASKTLPLGTKAEVTNLETGKSTVVTIEDRGPYRQGRIVDLPPKKAEEIGLHRKQGLATVQVKPLSVPEPDDANPVAKSD